MVLVAAVIKLLPQLIIPSFLIITGLKKLTRVSNKLFRLSLQQFIEVDQVAIDIIENIVGIVAVQKNRPRSHKWLNQGFGFGQCSTNNMGNFCFAPSPFQKGPMHSGIHRRLRVN